MGLSYKTKNNPASQHPLAMIAEHGSVNIDDMMNVRPGMMVRYEGRAPTYDANTHQYVGTDGARRSAKLSMALREIAGVDMTADKLNAWYKRLEARVAEIEADDAVMGNREEAKWRAEMDAFKADLN